MPEWLSTEPAGMFSYQADLLLMLQQDSFSVKELPGVAPENESLSQSCCDRPEALFKFSGNSSRACDPLEGPISLCYHVGKHILIDWIPHNVKMPYVVTTQNEYYYNDNTRFDYLVESINIFLYYQLCQVCHAKVHFWHKSLSVFCSSQSVGCHAILSSSVYKPFVGWLTYNSTKVSNSALVWNKAVH